MTFLETVIETWTKKPTCTNIQTAYATLASQLSHRGLDAEVRAVIATMTEDEREAFSRRFPRLRAELRKVGQAPTAEASETSKAQ